MGLIREKGERLNLNFGEQEVRAKGRGASGSWRPWVRSQRASWEANQRQCPARHPQDHTGSDLGLESKSGSACP